MRFGDSYTGLGRRHEASQQSSRKSVRVKTTTDHAYKVLKQPHTILNANSQLDATQTTLQESSIKTS